MEMEAPSDGLLIDQLKYSFVHQMSACVNTIYSVPIEPNTYCMENNKTKIIALNLEMTFILHEYMRH